MTIGNGDLIRAAIVWKYNGSDEQINVWHTGVTNPAGSFTDFMDDLEEYYLDLYSEVKQNMVNNLVHDRIEIFNVTDNTPEPWAGSISGLTGIETGEALPSGVAALVYARTSQSRVIGKKYLPTFGEANLADGVWASGAQSALTDLTLKWNAPYVAANGTGFRSGVYSVAGATYYNPIAVQFSTVPAYQRRRKLGRGS